MARSGTIARPPLRMLGVEPLRAMMEYARMSFARDIAVARGDGHAVVLFPGLGADEKIMRPLAQFCERLGYECYDWGRGRNAGPRGDPVAWLHHLSTHVDAMVPKRHTSMSLIGWSLGGLYAREIAKALHRRVRQVVTLGSPSVRIAESTNVGWLYQLLGGDTRATSHFTKALKVSPPVPTTSIYSRSDGIVAWRSCRLVPGPVAQNVEVQSSHLGLVWHPDVWRVIADRLAQRPGQWRRWDPDAPEPAGRPVTAPSAIAIA